MRIRLVAALFLSVSCVFACDHDCSFVESHVDATGHIVRQSSQALANAGAHANGVATPPDAPRETRETDQPTLVATSLSGGAAPNVVPAIEITDGVNVLATMDDPQRTGVFALADLAAAACDDFADCGTDADVDARVDAGLPFCPPAQHICTPLGGRIEIDVYDASCDETDDSCTRFSAKLFVDPPPTLTDGPILFGEATTTETRVKNKQTCNGCSCGGGMMPME